MNITTQEASQRLGVSEATVKRRLTAGELPGTKIGGRWIVYSDKLPEPIQPLAAQMRQPPALDFGRAFTQVRTHDRRDLWIPDVLNWEDFAQDPTSIIERANIKCSSDSPVADPVMTVEVPKGDLLTRGGALLSLADRVAYQALCNELAPDIDARLSERVFSARLVTAARARDFFLPGVQQWQKFLNAAEAAQRNVGPWMVTTDLVSYFDTISHRLLFAALENLPGHDRTIKLLRRLIDQWRGDSHHGLPTGPEASRLLGNYFLSGVDAFMISKGFEYFRYMDDIRIVAPTRDEALRGLRLLEIECRKLGLIISSAKTVLHEEVQGTQDEALNLAGYFFQRRIDESRPILRELLRQAVDEKRPKVKHAKFALLRLAALVDAPALGPVLERLASLKEAAPESAIYLRAFVGDLNVQAALSDYLQRTPEPILEVYQQAWLIAAMLELRGDAPVDWVDYGVRIAEDLNKPSYLRGLAFNLVAKSSDRADVERIRRILRGSYDPEVLRGAAVALARANALDKDSHALVEARAPHLNCTLRYLKGRKGLPSLVQEGLWSSIRS